LDKGGGWKGKQEYNGGGELVQVHCMYTWNHHNEIPLHYVCKFKNKTINKGKYVNIQGAHERKLNITSHDENTN
jgi:hypothetical protein